MKFADQPSTSSVVRGVLGGVFLTAGSALALLLVLQHFEILNLPGVRGNQPLPPGIGQPWSHIAVWPVSFVALAYLAGLLAAWITMGGDGLPASFRNVVRTGALVSAAYVAVMVTQGFLCSYCWAIHAANLAFWLVVELSERAVVPSLQPLTVAVVGFALVSSVLNVIRTEQKRLVAERAEAAIAVARHEQDRTGQALVAEGEPGDAVVDARGPSCRPGRCPRGQGNEPCTAGGLPGSRAAGGHCGHRADC